MRTRRPSSSAFQDPICRPGALPRGTLGPAVRYPLIDAEMHVDGGIGGSEGQQGVVAEGPVGVMP